MKTILAGFGLCLLSLFSCQPKGDFRTLSVSEFESVIADPGVQRLDVRTPAEYTEGHIPGSLNINVLDQQFEAVADSVLSKEAPVALYCRSGKRSKKAAALLSKKGFQVYELDGGINDWLSAGRDVEK